MSLRYSLIVSGVSATLALTRWYYSKAFVNTPQLVVGPDISIPPPELTERFDSFFEQHGLSKMHKIVYHNKMIQPFLTLGGFKSSITLLSPHLFDLELRSLNPQTTDLATATESLTSSSSLVTSTQKRNAQVNETGIITALPHEIRYLMHQIVFDAKNESHNQLRRWIAGAYLGLTAAAVAGSIGLATTLPGFLTLEGLLVLNAVPHLFEYYGGDLLARWHYPSRLEGAVATANDPSILYGALSLSAASHLRQMYMLENRTAFYLSRGFDSNFPWVYNTEGLIQKTMKKYGLELPSPPVASS
eukprot:TRINITY_DN4685_c0_g1_i1.p1 TRINITY_DN4685_c0_g1~~TRINITY_DN4685_c0_g1_i1.p1  ORF type:complete len:302 (+),score=71.61 TRINITY_DN4685_c0_g1_i1:75-980(+)